MKTIKQLHKDDKPREKLVRKGVDALKNDEKDKQKMRKPTRTRRQTTDKDW